MRAVVQRVSEARVKVNNLIVGEIGFGLLVLVGFSKTDSAVDFKYIADKILNLRIFEDSDQKMNLSLVDIDGELLIVSQFTLYGDVRKGRRPSFIEAAPPEDAKKLYEEFLAEVRKSSLKVATGEFQAMMDVELVNSGPVTILLDSAKIF